MQKHRTIGDRNSVIVESIDDPTYSNYLDIDGYESEDSEIDKEGDQYLVNQRLRGLSSEDGDPVERKTSFVNPTNTTVVQPD